MNTVIDGQLDPETQRNVDRWLNEDYDNETKSKVRDLLAHNPKEVVDAFYTTMSFGTGGLRGIMGVGSNRMNIYTIRAATQGLANYIKSQTEPQQEPSVLIGYDSRHNSRAFAEESAKVLAGNGIKVWLFKELRPTPLVSFGCRYKKCTAAIMITASHNPPEYNGYKVYWSDGAQVLPPHDKNIIDHVREVTDLSMIKQVPNIKNPIIVEIDTEIDQAYLNVISRLQNYSDVNSLHGEQLKIVYTSLHGTGITLMPAALERWGFKNVHFVDKQIIPDGDFPTASSPNPEDIKALELGIKKLEEINGDILIATDPDADRVGVVIRHNGKNEIFTGNQIASLLLNHVCEALSTKNKLPANGACIKTFVTTELFQAIADYFQKPCFNVLPGFKYIAEKIRIWEQEPRSHQYIFGGEESYGYLYGTQTRDKDAIAISALICEMALQAKIQGKTLINFLHDLYNLHGVYEEVLESIKFEESKAGKEKMRKSMQLLRRAPPKMIGGLKILSFEDFEQSIKMNFLTQEHETLQQPKSDMLLFILEDGTKLIIRPSGTEPKIKIYCGIVDKSKQPIDKAIEACKKRAKSLIKAIESKLQEE
jgi:phosphoglucomutase/phosphomannomutase